MLNIAMPPLLSSIQTPVGVFANHAEQHALAWTSRHDLVSGDGDLARLAAMKPGALAAHCYPAADRNQACTLANWMSWLFILDDRYDEASLGWFPDEAERSLSSMFAAAFEPTGAACEDALSLALASIWRDVSASMTAAWRRRFARHIASYFDACAWQAAHRAMEEVPRLDTFAQMRRDAGAIWPSLDLIEWVTGRALPPALYLTSTYQALLGAAADVVCWTNDLLTLDKEMSHGETQNMVLVMQAAQGGELQHAVDTVVRLADARIVDFLQAETALESVLGRLRFQEPERAHVAECLAMLRSWMRGHVDWGAQTRRYWQAESLLTEAAPCRPRACS